MTLFEGELSPTAFLEADWPWSKFSFLFGTEMCIAADRELKVA